MKTSLLQKIEVPANIADAYILSSQRLMRLNDEPSRVMVIDQKCLKCRTVKIVRVSVVRSGIRKEKLTGLCTSCCSSWKMSQRKVFKRPKGGKFKTPEGYIMIRAPSHPNARNGYILEHRLVMEKEIGRNLVKGETVHHKNGVKDDNGIGNLELWGHNHSDGCRYEDLSTQDLKTLILNLQEMLSKRIGNE